MTDRPILFSTPMVRALLAGTKTQTRRVLLPQPYMLDGRPGYWNASGTVGGRICISDRALLDLHRKPKPGDRLYVREAWRSAKAYDDLSPSAMGGEEPLKYEADGGDQMWGYPGNFTPGRFRQGMHMPRWASRLTLTVTDVRVQRLQDISAEDARDEGVERRSKSVRQMWLFGANQAEREAIYLQACIWEFEQLWNRLNAERGYGWDTNPWVVAISFTVERRNIDEVRP